MGAIKDTFKKRKEYDSSNPNFNLPENNSLYTKYYLDTWNISPFYGKVDTLGIPVVPKPAFLRFCTFGNDPEQFLVLQPVLNFFFPLRQEYEKFYILNAFNKNSKFYKNKLAPKRAFIDSNQEYYEFLQRVYRDFVDYLLGINKFNSIKNYDDFINELLVYIKAENKYLTRAGYVESYDFSILHTGLGIDIYNGNGLDDNLRLEYYQDINSEAFLELCVRTNMKIDREIPWRIFPDIRTKGGGSKKAGSIDLDFATVIKEFIPDFKDDLQLFFDKFYDRVIPYDENSFAYYEEFVNVLRSFYFSFVRAYPTYKLYLINKCGNADVKVLERDTNDENPFSYDRAKYVDLYLRFRNVELSKVVPEEKLNFYLQNANELYKLKNKGIFDKVSIIEAIKYHTNNVGTLAYRNPSLYELDEKSKMP